MSTTVSTGMVMSPTSVFFTQRRKVLQKVFSNETVLLSEWIISNMQWTNGSQRSTVNNVQVKFCWRSNTTLRIQFNLL